MDKLKQVLGGRENEEEETGIIGTVSFTVKFFVFGDLEKWEQNGYLLFIYFFLAQ